ncbi:hypothetical protein TrST_g13707 [Triparma strigata]|uniref:Cap-specific mRNA (nucleoside-2'-O-)-methyltransferase 1 n=1 Tax=Triparma strigata TaxID=1606541 RepID=A0A9W7BVD0_9STRA|nr:hypothetical protein TrST_g13707 [Triparma strigata]
MGRKSKKKHSSDIPNPNMMDIDTAADSNSATAASTTNTATNMQPPQSSKKKRRRPHPKRSKSSNSNSQPPTNPNLRNCWLIDNDTSNPFVLSTHLQWHSPPSSTFSSSHSSQSSPPSPPIPPSSLLPLKSSLLTSKKSLSPLSLTHSSLLNHSLLPTGPTLLLVSPSTPSTSFLKSRVISNPFDVLTTRRGVSKNFVNRSATKLSNIDHVINYTLTKVGDVGGCFKWVDLCGAPGGFSEYVIFRLMGEGRGGRGWGISLNGVNEGGRGCPWRLEHLIGVMREGDLGYKVVEGEDGTGDIYNIRNVEELRREVERDSREISSDVMYDKVHLVVADGGFDAQRDEENQEVIAAKLVACQAAAGVGMLASGGIMVLKYFGAMEDQTRHTMEILASCFMRITVIKPVTSRPASAERYLVCDNFLSPPDLPTRISLLLHPQPSSPVYTSVTSYLSHVDLKMLHLNIKGVNAILSVLQKAVDMEMKLEAIQKSDPVRKALFKGNVDVEEYKRAWNL